jgi:hypothetical protein
MAHKTNLPNKKPTSIINNLIGGVMVSMFTSSAVDRRFETSKVSICFFSAKHAALRSKNKYWLLLNQNNVSACGEI